MVRFLIRRLLLGLVVLWLITLLVFIVFYVTPNDVARQLAGHQARPETIALVEQRLGLDRPLWERYASFVGGALRGDLGFDYYHQVPVTEILSEAAPKTVSLAFGATVLWVFLGVGGGVCSAARPGSLLDRGLTMIYLFFYCVPSFVVGLLLLYFLYFQLTLLGVALFPAGGYVPLTEDPAAWFSHLALPWLCLALAAAAPYSRLTRATLLAELGENYVRTALSTGLSRRQVILRHASRNALAPVLTQLGIDIGTFISSVVIVETVFSIDGLGRAAVTAIATHDQPVIIGIVLVTAAVVVATNILIDIGYRALDPRVRVS